MDDFISKVTAGQFNRADWNKLSQPVSAAVAGEWSCLHTSSGSPSTGDLTSGTANSWQSLSDQSAGAILHGGNVSPATKHIVNASAGSAAATTMPALMILCDLLGYYPRTSLTTTGDVVTVQSATVTADATTDIVTHTGYDVASFTRVRLTTTGTLPGGLSLATDYWTVRQSSVTSKLATSFANAVAGVTVDITSTGSGTHTLTAGLPRYTDGAGVQLFVTTTTATGTATPSMRVTYTDADGNASNLTPATLPVGKSAAGVGMLVASGTGAGKYGPFWPLAAGDRGIRSIEATNLSTSYLSGALAYVLARPLLTLPMAAIGVFSERDLLNQVPSLPQVQDGACLSWLLYNGAATPTNSPFSGHLDFAWG